MGNTGMGTDKNLRIKSVKLDRKLSITLNGNSFFLFILVLISKQVFLCYDFFTFGPNDDQGPYFLAANIKSGH